MRKMQKIAVHIKIGRSILESVIGHEMPRHFDNLFKAEAAKYGIRFLKDAAQYKEQFIMTKRYVHRKLSERKHFASHHHTHHARKNERPSSDIGQEILAMQDPDWIPWIEKSHPEYPDY